MRLLDFLRGSVLVEVQSSRPAYFLNCLHRAGISVRKPHTVEDGVLRLWISRRNFKRLRAPARQTGARVHILEKKGLFRVMRPFRGRWGLPVGAVLFAALLMLSSRYIWQIEVVGCREVTATQIRNELSALGFDIGCPRSVDVNALENRYLMGNERLSWLSVNIRGTTAYVEVREKGLPPVLLDPSVPTNVYAARDGVILSIADYGGTRMVEVGSPVSAGDLLVSGDWTDKYGVRRLSHCIAAVRAETRRETAVSVPFREEIRQKTGKNRKKISISLGKLKIPLYFMKKISYNEYDTVETVYPLRLGDFALPLRIHLLRVEEVRPETVTRSPQQARAEALTRLGFYERDVLADAVIRRRELQEEQSGPSVTLRALYYCEEEIGVAIPIEE